MVLLSSLKGMVILQHSVKLSDIGVVSRDKRSLRSGQLCDRRMRSLMGTLPRVCKDPADVGSAGPFRGKCYSVCSSGLGAGKGSGSNSSQPTGIVNTLPSATVICSVSNRELSAGDLNS